MNVSKVQNILSGKFNQQIHGPPKGPSPGPSPPAPKNVPKYYTVDGAGDSACNGKYSLSTTSGLHPHLVYTSTINHSYQLYAEEKTTHAAAGWRLAISGHQVFYLAENEDALPPETGWKVVTGKSPAPTLVAGPVTAE